MIMIRLLTAIVLAGGIILTLLFASTSIFVLITGLFWLGGAWEWSGLVRLKGIKRVLYTFFVAILMFVLVVVNQVQGWLSLVTSVALIWWMIACLLLFVRPHLIPLSLVAITGPFVLLPSWFLLVYFHQNLTVGIELILCMLFIVWAADVGAFFAGTFWGKVKLAPQISPGKTWEGFIGGIGLAVLVAFFASYLFEIPRVPFMTIAIATAMASVVGDLSVSLFKRNVGLKNSGNILPGHGGILDRIDSLTPAIPVFAFGLTVSGISV